MERSSGFRTLVASIAVGLMGWVPPSLAQPSSMPGPVIAVGGGPLSPATYRDMLRLAGGKDARVVVFPQASPRADGSIDLEHWREGGATRVSVMLKLRKKRKAVANAVAEADIIWFGGGAQLRLMKALKDAKLIDVIRARHRQGALIAGTSAGAAVLSEVMISGKVKRALKAGKQVTYRGLGILPQVIIDQHFVVRKRFGRLFTAVLDHPQRIGLGIGESAAVLWQPKTNDVTVISDGLVVVVDARSSKVATKRGFQQASDVRIHTLTRGDRWALEAR